MAVYVLAVVLTCHPLVLVWSLFAVFDLPSMDLIVVWVLGRLLWTVLSALAFPLLLASSTLPVIALALQLLFRHLWLLEESPVIAGTVVL